jgi:hypothetical protein
VLTNGRFNRTFFSLIAATVFAGCATPPQHRAYSDTSSLVPGKTTVAECRALYGEPKETDVRTSASGRVEIHRYGEAGERWSKACVRILIAEFKEGVLNGYGFVSSFPEDHTSYSLTNIAKLEWAVSTKTEVSEALGKPHGRFLCPTTLFSDNCKITGREIWLFANLEPFAMLAPTSERFSFPMDITTITFDQNNIVMDITKKQGAHF